MTKSWKITLVVAVFVVGAFYVADNVEDELTLRGIILVLSIISAFGVAFFLDKVLDN